MSAVSPRGAWKFGQAPPPPNHVSLTEARDKTKRWNFQPSSRWPKPVPREPPLDLEWENSGSKVESSRSQARIVAGPSESPPKRNLV